MKQNPTFSYDKNTDLHQLLDFQKKRNQTLISGNTEMQEWTAQLNEDTYGKTGLGQRLVLGWMDGSKVRKWVAPELYATASNYWCTTVCFAFSFFMFGCLECSKHSTAEVYIKVKRIIKLLRFLQN